MPSFFILSIVPSNDNPTNILNAVLYKTLLGWKNMTKAILNNLSILRHILHKNKSEKTELIKTPAFHLSLLEICNNPEQEAH